MLPRLGNQVKRVLKTQGLKLFESTFRWRNCKRPGQLWILLPSLQWQLSKAFEEPLKVLFSSALKTLDLENTDHCRTHSLKLKEFTRSANFLSFFGLLSDRGQYAKPRRGASGKRLEMRLEAGNNAIGAPGCSCALLWYSNVWHINIVQHAAGPGILAWWLRDFAYSSTKESGEPPFSGELCQRIIQSLNDCNWQLSWQHLRYLHFSNQSYRNLERRPPLVVSLSKRSNVWELELIWC